ncbi:hypothetical protein CFAM422_012186 [Trichoderma lentiforme]|uniref:Uncharacterized protein n=1 Tax=Trichoderma lentiforme TaxID=1567552 RepID=A0A9P4X4F1_9HYPO|nr:hypothetical protein CFAM422_012186 [Trichoderma lentiforme]
MAKPPVGETTRIEVVIQPIACWDNHQEPEYGGRVVCNPREVLGFYYALTCMLKPMLVADSEWQEEERLNVLRA